jgi:hypothetical protein
LVLLFLGVSRIIKRSAAALCLAAVLAGCVSAEELQAQRDAQAAAAQAQANEDAARRQQQQAADDETCRSYGLTPGPDGAYADCRMRREMMRVPAFNGLPAPHVELYASPPVYVAPLFPPSLYTPPIW